MIFTRALCLTFALCALPTLGATQANSDETLADIRQELAVLYSNVSRLRREFSTSGFVSSNVSGQTSLDRLNAIEGELQRLTSHVERLEFRVERIVSDGTNRVSDLEFRLCELDEQCDISELGDTPSLGYIEGELEADQSAQNNTSAVPSTDLAVGESRALERARAALEQGDTAETIELLQSFSQTYPGSPLTQDASVLLGEAYSAQGQEPDAARAYLAAFSADPSGDQASRALYSLGDSLAKINQTGEACITLQETSARYPGDVYAQRASQRASELGCQ